MEPTTIESSVLQSLVVQPRLKAEGRGDELLGQSQIAMNEYLFGSVHCHFVLFILMLFLISVTVWNVCDLVVASKPKVL
ncbi:hypothetical protein KEM48_008671 [Puccinia striiformis f. sp. tritici PST-130]|nr:hypothetical protein KEM48_008671 [Puccinia striiformis f. sp. tritici PST-130]